MATAAARISRSSYSSCRWWSTATSRRVPDLAWTEPATRIGWWADRKDGSPTHLPGDHVPDAADGGDIVVGRRFGQLPVEMQLALTIFGYTA